MPKPWIEPQEVQVPEPLRQAVGGHPLVTETLARRGITKPDQARSFLDPHYYQPSAPTDLPGLNKAADRLQAAIKAGETILVWGDFDVDGQTATTLLVEALQDLGGRIRYHIPVRATEGHGIQTEVLTTLLQPMPGNPELVEAQLPTILLTCDTGISAHQAVELANTLDITVIITDHHEPSDSLPPAFAIINPHLLPSTQHPLANLPGVGVAYMLVQELYRRHGIAESALKYLDLVALGIVVDVAEQSGDTRYLLQLGLEVLRNTTRLGLQALFKMAEINPANLDESHISFAIGPRLNALGRLSDANPIVEFLMTSDSTQAEIMAIQIDGLNQRRRILTDQVYQGALSQLENQPELKDYAALVLAHSGWPGGILGLVASRLAEDYHKPAILFSIDEHGLAAGSARSIPGINITDAIKEQADLLDRFGGHAGAAGLSLPENEIPEFRTRISRTLKAMISAQVVKTGLEIDAYVELPEVTLELVDEIQRMAPFGAGNPALVLASHQIQMVSATTVGRSQEHRRLVVSDKEDNVLEILWWRGAQAQPPPEEIPFDLAFRVSSNTYRGERRLQVEWVDYRFPDGIPIQVQHVPQSGIEIIDYRHENQPVALLVDIAGMEKLQVWAEGGGNLPVETLDRFQLTTRLPLVIWNMPPGPRVLGKVLQDVMPDHIYWFANDPNLDSLQPFLTRLGGLTKHAIQHKGGEATLEDLAASMAHNPGTIHMGLLWLQANGSIQVDIREGEIIKINTGSREKTSDLPTMTKELVGLLNETAEFRKFLTHASKEALVRFLPTQNDGNLK